MLAGTLWDKKKRTVKREKDFLDNHKKTNGIARLTAAFEK
jgi:hypothetical protein